MSYEKQTWETGQIITAEKLNHMEDGIAGAGGEALKNPVLTINCEISQVPLNLSYYKIENGNLIAEFQEISTDTSVEVLTIYNPEATAYGYPLTSYLLTDVTDLVNATVQGENGDFVIIVTDPTQPASCTLSSGGTQ